MYSEQSALRSRILGINRDNDVIPSSGNKHGVQLAKVSREGDGFCGAGKTLYC